MQSRTLLMLKQTRTQLERLVYRPGVHSRNRLLAAGLTYTGVRDTTLCGHCGLEVSDWTIEMVPFAIHSERSPRCPYVCFIKTSGLSSSNISMSNIRQMTPATEATAPVALIESSQLQNVRKRTFSHWPHETTPSARQMVEAGFFNCNIGDRVICIYCNLICEKWTPNVDDPCDVHKILSPNCIYTKSFLTYRGPLSIINGNGSSMTPGAGRNPLRSTNIHSFEISDFVRPDTSNNSPDNSVNDSILPNYFSIDKKTTVSCPWCRKSFRNLDSDENPMVDHVRRFPRCPYVQRFPRTTTHQTQQNDEAESPWDKRTISRMARDRLKLPVSQTLIKRNYPLSIVKQCWGEQLRIKGEEFVSDLDLKLACLVLQKQCEHFRTERYVSIPSQRISQMREREIQAQAETIAGIRESAAPIRGPLIHLPITSECVVCYIEKRILAFLPCGHLTTCVPCGYSLNLCPMCRQRKEAMVAIHT